MNPTKPGLAKHAEPGFVAEGNLQLSGGPLRRDGRLPMRMRFPQHGGRVCGSFVVPSSAEFSRTTASIVLRSAESGG